MKCMASMLGACSLLLGSAGAFAHETDNYTVPRGKEFADLGPIFTDIFYTNIETAVERTNRAIRQQVQAGADPQVIAKLQSPETIARALRNQFSPTLSMIDDIDRFFTSKQMRDRFPGQITAYRRFSTIYDHASFFLDPRQVFKLWRAHTVMINGTYLGTDKLGHFVCKGYIGYVRFRAALRDGASLAEAEQGVVELGTGGHLFYSEKGMVGYMTSGVMSNADLAVDYLGTRFFHHLTEPVRLRGQMRPPMLVRNGDYWEIAPHVRRDSDFFTVYVTDHWDEVLNPNLMEAAMRKAVRKAIVSRADNVLMWYADRLGNRRAQAYFDDRMKQYSTYYGEEYGHEKRYDDMVTMGNTVLAPFEFGDDVTLRSPLGETALHDAAGRGDVERVEHLIKQGADVNAPVRSLETYSSDWGSTPLHYAARGGHRDVAEMLMASGANVTATNDNGVTALHRAAQHVEVLRLLLEHEVDVKATDALGRTPLHWAAAYPETAAIELLLDYGADVDARDHSGRSPLHHASLWAEAQAVELLAARGADVNAGAQCGVTPLHVAVQKGHIEIVKLLIHADADMNAADEFGWTLLHEGAARNRVEIVSMILAGGANADVADAYGCTPLHEAARRGHKRLAESLLAHGADVHAANSLGKTALHEAGFKGHRQVYDMLVSQGADAQRRDYDGVTARRLIVEAQPTVAELFGRMKMAR